MRGRKLGGSENDWSRVFPSGGVACPRLGVGMEFFADRAGQAPPLSCSSRFDQAKLSASVLLTGCTGARVVGLSLCAGLSRARLPGGYWDFGFCGEVDFLFQKSVLQG